MSGGEAIEQIMSVHPVPILVLAGGVRRAARQQALASLGAGALEALAQGPARPARSRAATPPRAFRRRVKLLSRVRVLRHPRGGARPAPAAAGGLRHAAAPRSIGICASTGGPQALASVLARAAGRLPDPDPRRPAHHPGLHRGLRPLARRPGPAARAARGAGPRRRRGSGSRPRARICCSTAGGRLVLDDRREAGAAPAVGGRAAGAASRPSRGRDGVAVVLTGMGRDGAAGARGGPARRRAHDRAGRGQLRRVRHAQGGGGAGRRARPRAEPDRRRACATLRRAGAGVMTPRARTSSPTLVHRESGIRLAEHQHAFLQSALARVGAGADPDAFLRRLADPRRGARLRRGG